MTKRQYDQYCPLASSLDIVGERWAMLVVRELLSGPKRFVDLEAGLPGIGTNTLATRLDELEAGGVIARRRLPPPSPATVYDLTEWGRELEPVVIGIARWGSSRLATLEARYPLRATWFAIALKAFFQRAAVRDLKAVVELAFPTGTLTLRFARGDFDVVNGPAEAPALRLVTSEQTFLEFLLTRGARPRGKDFRVEGDASLLPRLAAAFPLKPETADSP
ncbi:MAG: winged helix-turn-helix transcriptional regulator [Bauldia sp.]